MDIRILGSLEVLIDGRNVALGGARQRGVLAILLLHRGEVVPVDRIAEELWAGRPPPTATKTVQVYVSRLRKALGDGALVTRGGGYALEVGADSLDAVRFERLASEGREALDRGDPRSSARLLNAALDLWRGPALADLAYEEFAQNEIGRLEELRVAAVESRIDAELALGRHRPLVPELESLVAEHPGRERLRGQLMLALYRTGRQAEALESYRDARRALVEEMGLEPSPELQRLERAILAQDPAIDGPARGGPVAALRSGRPGVAVALLGGGLLLAAVALAVALISDGGSEPQLASANSVAVIEPESDRVVASVPTGVGPADVSAGAGDVWVANHTDDSATRIDPETKTVVSTTSPQNSVAGLAAGTDAVWIATSRGSELIRVDPASQSVRSIPLAGRLVSLEFAPVNPVAVGHGAVWSTRTYGEIARIDPNTDKLVATIPVGNSPRSIATGLGAVWVTDDTDNSVSRIDPESANAVTATTPVGQGPSAVAVGEGAVWVANTHDDTVARIDPGTAAVTATIPVGSRPMGVAVGGGAVWVANSLGGTVSRIDPETNRVEATIEVGEAPQGLTFAHGLLWVSVQAGVGATEAAPVAFEDDIARIVAEDDPAPIDPALADGDDFERLGATCALLYNYPDRPFPEGARLQPEVAAGEPAISNHGRRYAFTIRPGFRFSPPSNEPVTAAAFERAIERVLSPKMGSYARALVDDIVGAAPYKAGRSRDLTGVIARGDRLIVKLTKPVPNLVEQLSTPWFCAVPPDTPISDEGVDQLPSAGPYYVASHLVDRSLVLRRNPNYEGDRPNELEEIRYRFGVPPARGAEEVESGRADYVDLDPALATPAPAELTRELTARYGPRSEAASAGRQQLFTQPGLSLYYFIFNPTRGPFVDPQLRRAVNYAIDRHALAAHTGVGQTGRPTDQYIPPGAPGFEDATIYPLGDPDLATARRLAGDIRRRAVLYTCNLPGCTRHAQILEANLRAIGIELDVRQFPLGELFDRIARPGEPWDLTYWNWFPDYPDPSNFINDLFAPGGLAPTSLDDPGIEERMAAAARLTGRARLRAYAEVDRALSREPVAAVFATGTVSHFVSARMGCEVLHPIYGLDLAALCVEDEPDAN
jgi:YVTN family beta-propeller protein